MSPLGNIPCPLLPLLCQNEAGARGGLLKDSELSTAFEEGITKKENRQPDRTRTWEFASVRALVNHSRVITVSDDLESFFHVMLYFAIRFLPHNASDVVGELLFNYFDDHTNGKLGQTSGSTKYMAMHDGQIDITRFTGTKIDKNGESVEEFLTFLWPDDGSESTSEPTDEVNQRPIDLIVSDLLQWFKALYAKDKKLIPRRPGPKMVKCVLGDLPLALPGMELSDPSASVRPQTAKSEKLAALAQAQRLVQLAQLEDAQKLENHDAMVELLTEYVGELEWPATDKVPDMKPKNGYSPPKDNIPATSTKTGSKRALEDAPAGPGSKSKRIRSKARA